VNGKKPFVVLVKSKIAEAFGDVVPMPTWAKERALHNSTSVVNFIFIGIMV
jgi:hypothetical protein